MASIKDHRKPRWIAAILALLAVVAVGVVWLNPFSANEGAAFGDVDVRQARGLIDKRADRADFVVLDVRTPEEFAAGHLPVEGGTLRNLDFYADGFRQQLDRLDRDVTYLVYCRTDNRSGEAIAMMQGMGFERLYNLDGGIVAWQDAGLALAR